MPIRIANAPEDIAHCFPVIRELRPALSGVEEFVERVQLQQAEGFQLALLETDGHVVTVAGFRIQHILATGLTLYVDDLVTASSARSQGHGKAMLDFLIALARERGCQFFTLDSGNTGRMLTRFISASACESPASTSFFRFANDASAVRWMIRSIHASAPSLFRGIRSSVAIARADRGSH